MTYRLNPAIEKIASPVIIVFPNGVEREYECGKSAAESSFDCRYCVSEVKARDSKIAIYLEEMKSSSVNWIGEEAVSFF